MHGMLELNSRHAPIADLLARQLEQVSVIFERQLASDLSAINGLCVHIESYRGKMLRPTLVLLTGLAASPETHASEDRAIPEEVLTERHRVVAAVVEMIHMATLVHDDVLDEATVRRNGATVNHLWGNEAAVMLGDYLISNAFHLCSSLGDPAINLSLGAVTNTLCEGELIQLHHRENYGIDEDTYIDIVRRKTASLIGECCRLGASISGASEAQQSAFKHFGLCLGIAFQIQDDLLDLTGDQRLVGKDLGKDLDKGKLTLPITHLMATIDKAEQDAVVALLRERRRSELHARLEANGSVAYARETAHRYVDEAKAALDHLPSGVMRELLDHLADRVVQRSA
jgi:octaprenyl-diphosphate synthase